jgi:hypothetical protein
MEPKKAFIIAILSMLVSCGGIGTNAFTYPVKYTNSAGETILPAATGVAVDTSFTATFVLQLVGTSLEGNYFIVPGTKALPNLSDYDNSVCQKSHALPSELSDCDGVATYACTLTPVDPLESATAYSLCIGQDAKYVGGKNYEGSTLSFTTE